MLLAFSPSVIIVFLGLISCLNFFVFIYLLFQEGNLVSWNILTNETSVIVSKELLASVSEGKTAHFCLKINIILDFIDISSNKKNNYCRVLNAW
jgi:hypothetical protein